MISPTASVPDEAVIPGPLERLQCATPEIVEGDGDITALSGDVIEMIWKCETFPDFSGPYPLRFGSDIVMGNPVDPDGGDDSIDGDAVEVIIDAGFRMSRRSALLHRDTISERAGRNGQYPFAGHDDHRERFPALNR